MINTVAINHDKDGIEKSRAAKKILIEDVSSSELDRVQHEAHALLQNTGALILLACLGGTTGSNASTPIITAAQKLHIPVLAIVSLPFNFEGEKRSKKAQQALANIEDTAAKVAIYSCQQLMESADADTTIEDAFHFVDAEVIKLISNYSAWWHYITKKLR